MNENDPALEQMKMDSSNLYKEETYTDRKMGSLHILTPVDTNGEVDSARDIIYLGNTQLMTPYGAMPLSFEIEANSISEALERFGETAKEALDRTIEEAKEYQREKASSIVIPDADTASKIQLK
ncbi:MAG: hypothetical protein HUJ29_03600 [Gammaproteobacteria bacterium]|nr:hypothetical protein [Gammaproteobacteria bacterium]